MVKWNIDQLQQINLPDISRNKQNSDLRHLNINYKVSSQSRQMNRKNDSFKDGDPNIKIAEKNAFIQIIDANPKKS